MNSVLISTKNRRLLSIFFIEIKLALCISSAQVGGASLAGMGSEGYPVIPDHQDPKGGRGREASMDGLGTQETQDYLDLKVIS